MFKGYNLGTDYYMTKPFTKAQLVYGLKLMFSNSPLKKYQPGTMNGKDTFFKDSFKSP